MVISKISGVFFSPTDTTKKIVTSLAKEIGMLLQKEVELLDFTLPAAREKSLNFDKNELVLIGVPVYAGRVPNLLLPYLNKMLEGNGALCVPVVLFGNRNYDDALIELRNIMEKNGFHTIAAGAFVGEHSFSKVLGSNRPDGEDMNLIPKFSHMICERVLNLDNSDQPPVFVKGNDPISDYYKPQDRRGNFINILKVKPKTNDDCDNCKLCAMVCPMGSIPLDNVKTVDGICIKCGACIKKCHVGAKYYDDEGYLYHQHELEEVYERRGVVELF